MIAKILSGAIIGVEGYIVSVETDLSPGLPGFDIVGLPDSAVKESRERVRSAIINSGYAFPAKRITVNLAPADVRKEGPSFDLPIAVGILCCMGVINAANRIFFTGELSLDGSIRPVNGVLPMVHGAFSQGVKNFVIPGDNVRESLLVEGVRVISPANLKELVSHFKEQRLNLALPEGAGESESPLGELLDFRDVKGQDSVKRALEIAAAGGHNVLMIGPPGTGKTMLAKRIPGVLPDLTFSESVEVTKIYSVAGMIRNKGALITRRPFRAPHHTISYSALAGGGRNPKPGEISLAHRGVLFLDELPEFQKNVLEILRQPLEEGEVTISRVNSTITYPSDFILVASMNPCPCGFYGQGEKCSCSHSQVRKYLSKISGPLLDRIDIQTEAGPVDFTDYSSREKAESSMEIKKRVEQVRAIQKSRYSQENFSLNAQLPPGQIRKYCSLDNPCGNLLKAAHEKMGLSPRGLDKIVKTARTIADLESRESIAPQHIAEAIHYRSLDRKYWNSSVP